MEAADGSSGDRGALRGNRIASRGGRQLPPRSERIRFGRPEGSHRAIAGTGEPERGQESEESGPAVRLRAKPPAPAFPIDVDESAAAPVASHRSLRWPASARRAAGTSRLACAREREEAELRTFS